MWSHLIGVYTVFYIYNRDTTKNVSTAFRVTKLWIRYCTVTGPMTKCTVEVNENAFLFWRRPTTRRYVFAVFVNTNLKYLKIDFTIFARVLHIYQYLIRNIKRYCDISSSSIKTCDVTIYWNWNINRKYPCLYFVYKNTFRVFIAWSIFFTFQSYCLALASRVFQVCHLHETFGFGKLLRRLRQRYLLQRYVISMRVPLNTYRLHVQHFNISCILNNQCATERNSDPRVMDTDKEQEPFKVILLTTG